MVILVGDTRKNDFLINIKQLGWGRMVTTKTPKPYLDEPWGFDNGAFAAWRNKRPFPADEFLKRLDKAYHIGIPYIAVCPDIVAAGKKSLDFSLNWLEKLPADWPWYLAIQDGMTHNDVSPFLSKFKGIFLGGSDTFKREALGWCKLAHLASLKFHYGRAGIIRKIDHAIWCKADSLDSSFPLWTRKRFYNYIDIICNPKKQPRLISEGESYVIS